MIRRVKVSHSSLLLRPVHSIYHRVPKLNDLQPPEASPQLLRKIYSASTHTYPQTKSSLKMSIPNISFKVQKRAERAKGFRGFWGSKIHEVSPSELSFPVLFHFVGLAPALRGSLGVTARAQVHLVYLFERLVQVVLERGHCGADGGRAKTVRDEAEMSQAALDSRLQNGCGPRVSQRRPVLSEQISELLADLPEGRKSKWV